MHKSLSQKPTYKYIATFLIFYVIFLFILNPEKYTVSVYNGLMMFALNVLPALFPFFFLTKLLTFVGNAETMTSFLKKPVKKFLKFPPSFAYIFFISILSGYPVGAKLVSETCEGEKGQLTRMAASCSASGPVFLIGTVGFSLLGDKKAGFLLYVAHIASVLLFAFVSAIFVKGKENIVCLQNTVTDKALSESVYDSVISILIAGGFITVFYMLCDMLGSLFIYGAVENALSQTLNFFSLPNGLGKGLLSGIAEMTRGCRDISLATAPLSLKLSACAFTVTLGGICITAQCLAFLKNKISIGKYLLYKLIQAIFATAICYMLCTICGI